MGANGSRQAPICITNGKKATVQSTSPYYTFDLERTTNDNKAYRRVIYSAANLQLVLMSIAPKGAIPSERHPHTDQFIRVESGEGKAIINGGSYDLTDNSAVIIPAGSLHRIVNTSSDLPLKLYTLYSPPEHKSGLVQYTDVQDALESSS